MNSANSESRTW
jgi:hypothetical protein